MKQKNNRKESKRKNKARFNKEEIIKLKKENKDKEENIDKLKKKMEKNQNKKFKSQMKKEKTKVTQKFSDISRRRRFKVCIVVTCIIFTIFIFRIAWIQFIDGDKLKQMAYEQQSLDRAISPRRGTIYDATGKTILAVSSTVNTITVNPNNIAK